MSDDKTLPGKLDGADRPASTDSERIGNYRLLSKLGEGGMGEVYQAEQEQPVQRIVALKLIKFGMDTKQVIARFESERQALALMNHAHIARVFDAGATETGRPYFVMEYIDGIPIDDYCDRNGLGTRERLELFLQVCDGVQHAHQKGVIHRDIKPSNILVRVQDQKPVPKIIDFGVAKATTQRLTQQTMFTEMGQLVGTPAYMSPEQAEMSGLDVDTRSDVYSLGVLLYKLLVGTLPFDVRKKGIDEIRRTILEEEPQRPSTRASLVGQAGELPTLDRAALARGLRGDLDWITMKALEKDRARRYPSVSELAADVRRHLAHQPVLAGPPSATYRMGKFIRRHRTGVAAGAVVVVAMVGGTAVATVGWIRALKAEKKASQEATAAKGISDFMVRLFEKSDPDEARGSNVTARDILDQAADHIRTGLDDQPLVQARSMDAIGRVYQKLGLYSEARPLLERALRIREEQLGQDDPEVAASLDGLGQLEYSLKNYDEALDLSRRALEIRKRVLPPDSAELAVSLHSVASGLWRNEDHARALPLFKQAVEIREKALGPDDPDLAASLHALGAVLKASGDSAGARQEYERARAIQLKTLGPDSPALADTLGDLANLLRDEGDFAGARVLYDQALTIKETALGPDHLRLATPLEGLADLLEKQGNHAGAQPLYERALKIAESNLGPENLTVKRLLWSLAGVHRELRDATVADRLYKRSLEISGKIQGANHPDTFYDQACFRALHGDPQGAIGLLGQAVDRGLDDDYLAEDPDLESLHRDPAFQALVAKVQERMALRKKEVAAGLGSRSALPAPAGSLVPHQVEQAASAGGVVP